MARLWDRAARRHRRVRDNRADGLGHRHHRSCQYRRPGLRRVRAGDSGGRLGGPASPQAKPSPPSTPRPSRPRSTRPRPHWTPTSPGGPTSSAASSAQVTADESAVTAAQASLSSAQDSLSDATLTSTIAGTVASLDLTVGQQVSGQASGVRGPRLRRARLPALFDGLRADSWRRQRRAAAQQGARPAPRASTSHLQRPGRGRRHRLVRGGRVGGRHRDGRVRDRGPGHHHPRGLDHSRIRSGRLGGRHGHAELGGGELPVVVDVTGSPTGLYRGPRRRPIIVKELQNVLEIPTAAIRFRAGTPTSSWSRETSHP